MEQFYDKVSASAAYIRAHIPQTPTVGIILGSGLGGLVDAMTDKTVIPYGDIPHFPCSTVAGHAGNLVIGRLGSQVAAALQGRFHYYEGFSMKEVTYPVYVLALLGVKTLIVTNACGGINRTFVPGDLMLLSDQRRALRPPLPGYDGGLSPPPAGEGPSGRRGAGLRVQGGCVRYLPRSVL